MRFLDNPYIPFKIVAANLLKLLAHKGYTRGDRTRRMRYGPRIQAPGQQTKSPNNPKGTRGHKHLESEQSSRTEHPNYNP